MSDDWQVVEEALNLRMVIAGRPEGDVKMAEAQIALDRLREREAQLKQRAADRETLMLAVADYTDKLVWQIRARESAEARVARLEQCVGLLPPKWADQFWFSWREHPGLPALAHEEEK